VFGLLSLRLVPVMATAPLAAQDDVEAIWVAAQLKRAYELVYVSPGNGFARLYRRRPDDVEEARRVARASLGRDDEPHPRSGCPALGVRLRRQRVDMTHERLRRFNTRDTYPEQRLDNDLCQVVKARGTLVFVRGQVGQDLASSASVAVGDPAGQAEQAMRNVQELLEEAGAGLADICKVTIYLTDPRYREPVYRTVGRWLKGVFPVSTGLVVSALARPEWLVEIDVIAVIPEEALPG
jgi:enamine deaminase RidA (YjgF/YER057c/UK114 family)